MGVENTINTAQSASVKVVSAIRGIPDSEWNNYYEIQSATPSWTTDPAQLELVALPFISLHRALLINFFEVRRVIASTYVPDGEPYEPNSFSVVDVGLPGLKAAGIGQTVLPLQLTANVRKETIMGRNGSTALRGFLHTGDIGEVAGQPVILDDAKAFIDNQYATLMLTLTQQNYFPSLIRGRGTLLSPARSRTIRVFKAIGLGTRALRAKRGPANNVESAMRSIVRIAQNLGTADEIINAAITAVNLLPGGDLPLLPAP